MRNLKETPHASLFKCFTASCLFNSLISFPATLMSKRNANHPKQIETLHPIRIQSNRFAVQSEMMTSWGDWHQLISKAEGTRFQTSIIAYCCKTMTLGRKDPNQEAASLHILDMICKNMSKIVLKTFAKQEHHSKLNKCAHPLLSYSIVGLPKIQKAETPSQ